MTNRIELLTLVPKGGNVAEIGTLEGGFAREMKSTRPDIFLSCVDNWKAPHEHCEAIARRTLESIPGVTIIKSDSSDGAFEFPDAHFDLVYIDADHTYRGCMRDILAWWPKVKKGGYLSGHDFQTKAAGDGWHTAIEVEECVKDWAASKNLPIEVTIETCPSWYVRKP